MGSSDDFAETVEDVLSTIEARARRANLDAAVVAIPDLEMVKRRFYYSAYGGMNIGRMGSDSNAWDQAAAYDSLPCLIDKVVMEVQAEHKLCDRWKNYTHYDHGGFVYPYVEETAIFGLLAGVANVFGVTPITEVRGFPDDAAKTTVSKFNAWMGDEDERRFTTRVRKTWLSLAEIKKYNWDQTVPGYMDDLTEPITCRELAELFLENTVPLLEGLGEPDDVRILICIGAIDDTYF